MRVGLRKFIKRECWEWFRNWYLGMPEVRDQGFLTVEMDWHQTLVIGKQEQARTL